MLQHLVREWIPTMALSRSFKETVQARALRDAAFRRALLREGIEALLEGDFEAAKTILRIAVLSGVHPRGTNQTA